MNQRDAINPASRQTQWRYALDALQTCISRKGTPKLARIEDMPEGLAKHMRHLPLPEFSETPYVSGPAVAERRVALVSTAGLSMRGEAPFGMGGADYRVIPGDAGPGDIVMSHISVNFDRTGYQRDWNVVLPLDRLREMASDGVIGSVADHHYSFMGATDPAEMESAAKDIAGHMAAEGVNAVLLLPV
jgi:D-proline reductase (dithiol) PrdB